MESQSFSTSEFVDACQDALTNGSWANTRKMVEMVLAVAEYEHFIQMMIDAVADARRAAEQEQEQEQEASATVDATGATVAHNSGNDDWGAE